jgi:hypothetical protein
MSMNLEIVDRPAQPYVAIRRTITMQTFADIADRLPGLFGWLAERGAAPAGPPFFRYLVIDMERELDVEAGVPVAAPVAGDDQLIAVTGAFLDEAAARGLTFDATETERGTRWGCRLELLLTNPAEEPDMNKWETKLAFRLAN